MVFKETRRLEEISPREPTKNTFRIINITDKENGKSSVRMRVRGEERGPFPYKRSLIKDLRNGQFALVDQTMGGLPGLHIFPYI